MHETTSLAGSDQIPELRLEGSDHPYLAVGLAHAFA
jgi:hypothetical protein